MAADLGPRLAHAPTEVDGEKRRQTCKPNKPRRFADVSFLMVQDARIEGATSLAETRDAPHAIECRRRCAINGFCKAFRFGPSQTHRGKNACILCDTDRVRFNRNRTTKPFVSGVAYKRKITPLNRQPMTNELPDATFGGRFRPEHYRRPRHQTRDPQKRLRSLSGVSAVNHCQAACLADRQCFGIRIEPRRRLCTTFGRAAWCLPPRDRMQVAYLAQAERRPPAGHLAVRHRTPPDTPGRPWRRRIAVASYQPSAGWPPSGVDDLDG